MQVTVSGKAQGTIGAPPSKSMAHRAVLAAALAKGTSLVKNLEWSADVKATLKAAQDFGAQVEVGENWAKITGIGQPTAPKTAVDCGESGSTLRFLIPILAQTAQPVSLVGHGRLPQRPQQVYADLFAERGLEFSQNEQGVQLCGPLSGGSYTLRGDVSSQFISGLLFALPLAKEDSEIHILPPFESRSYVELTLQTLAEFGVQVVWKDEYTLSIAGGQQYIARDVTVDGDWSNAAFPAVLGALTNTVALKGLKSDTKQGDAVIFDILRRCGVSITENSAGTFEFAKDELQGVVIDLADCPDLGPILMVLAAFCKGTTRIEHAGRLRIKESDRIEAMAAELKKFGVTVRQLDSETVEIEGSMPVQPAEAIDSHNDHRVVMACTVAALGAGLTVTIDDAQAVTKSWPAFFAAMQSLGVEVQQHEQ